MASIIPSFFVLMTSFIKSAIYEGYWKRKLHERLYLILTWIFLILGHYEVSFRPYGFGIVANMATMQNFLRETLGLIVAVSAFFCVF